MEKRFENGKAYITLGEKLDYDLAAAAEEEIRTFCMQLDGADPDEPFRAVQSIELDAEALTYISSAGIRLLLKLKKQIRDMRIIHVADNIYDTISITGMENLFGLQRRSGAAAAAGEGTQTAGAQKRAAQEGTAGSQTAAGGTSKAAGAERPALDRSAWQDTAADIALTGINSTTAKGDFYAVTELFEKQVALHENDTAVVSTKGSYTYGELNKAANRIANTLLYMGIQADDVVCILLERGIGIYAATLGVLKAGAAYTIANPKYPDERIEYIYRDAGCRYIISSKDMVYERLELFVDRLQKRPLFFEHLQSWPADTDPHVTIHPEDLCYLIYTSGSTGKPKGVMIEHGNLSNFLLDSPVNREFDGYAKKSSCCLAMAQMTFDFSVMEQYIPLVSGKKVAFALYEEVANPSRMIDFMNEHGVDGACFTPSYLTGLMKLPKSEEVIRRLKVIDFGAEAFPGTLYTRIREWNPDVSIMNGYGPTEATISCTMKVVDSADNVTIGIPNANVYVFVIDENGREVADGEMGELLICGQGVGRGYVNLPDKTAEVFINYHGMRAYRSGDLVRISSDKEIEYLGRKDHQVKIRGLRIELGEVESVFEQMPGIDLCVASSIRDRYLCLYYTTSTGLTEEQVRAYAKSHLAHYMVPDIYVMLTEMPLTPNHKIDRKALPEPVVEEKAVIGAQTEMQQELLDLLSSVMTEGCYGIDTNLMEIGMSSLDIMLLISLIGEKYEIGVSIGDLDAHPTIPELERFVQMAPKRKKRVKRDRYPATVTQMSDYAETVTGEGNINIPTIYELDPSVEDARLREAVYTMMEAHPGLLMRLETDESGMLWQIPQDNARSYEIRTVSMRDDEFDGNLKALSRRIASDAGRLYRFEIITTPTRKFLFTDYSHLIADGDSVVIAIEDVIAAYEGRKITPEYDTMFEFAGFLSEFWDTKAGRRCIDLYMTMLSDAGGPATLPPDRNDPGWDPKRIVAPLSADMPALRAFCLRNHITASTVLAGALGLVVAKHTGRRKAAFSYGYNGRSDSRLLRTFGPVASLLEVCCRTDGTGSCTDYLKGLQKELIDQMMFPMMPLAQVMAKYPAAIDICYLYQPVEKLTYEMDGRSVKAQDLQEIMPYQSIKAIFQPQEEQDGSISWVVDYHGNLYSDPFMHRIIAELNEAVNALITTDTMPLQG